MRRQISIAAICAVLLCAGAYARTQLRPRTERDATPPLKVMPVRQTTSHTLQAEIPTAGSSPFFTTPSHRGVDAVKAPARYPKGGPRLAGNVASSADGKGLGFNYISALRDETTELGNCSGNRPSYRAGDRFYSVRFEDYGWMSFVYYNVYDLKDWSYVEQYILGGAQVPTAACWNPEDNRVYGCYFKDENYNSYCFGYIDASYLTMDRAEHLETRQIKDLSNPWAAVVFGDGVCYAIDNNGTLGSVDITTGDFTTIGATGVQPSYLSGAAWDYEAKCIYWNAVPEDGVGYMYKVDVATGKAELQYVFSNAKQVFGLFMPDPEAADAAPAAAENFVVDFPQGSLEGAVKFSIPIECYDGSELSGQIGWTVTMDGGIVSSGTNQPGEKISASVSVYEASNHEFGVTLTNAAGPSPTVKAAMWVGPDTPLAVTGLEASAADGLITVSWDAVTTSLHGGYIDPEGVTYTVMRYPAGEMVANRTSATTVTIPYEPMARLSENKFTVIPHFGDLDGAASTSSSLWVGTVYPPYIDGFENDPTGKYTIIDANDDKREWYWAYWEDDPFMSNNAATTCDSDDWLISPAIYLEAGGMYHISWDIHAYKPYSGDDVHKVMFEIKLGTAPTAEAMETTLVEHTTHVGSAVQTYGDYFKPETSGFYYIGLRNLTPMDEGRNGVNRYYAIYADNFSVSESANEGAPAAPSGVEAKTAKDGSMSVTVTGTAPTLDNLGATLEAIESILVYRDGALVATLADVAPGGGFSYVDTGMTPGMHEWSVSATSVKGKGLAASVTARAGAGVPDAPADVIIVENPERQGEVVIEWSAPKRDVAGVSLAGTELTYDVVMSAGTDEQRTVARGVTGNKLADLPVLAQGEQRFVSYSVFANSNSGTSAPKGSNMIPIGEPYRMTFAESFANGSLKHAFGVTTNNRGAEWSIALDDYFGEGISSQDKDNGLLVFGGNNAQNKADGTLYTGKILIDQENPVFTFYIFNIQDCLNSVDVSAVCDGEEDWLGTFVPDTGQGWELKTLSLSEYAGKTIYLRLQAVINNLNFCIFDNMHVKADVPVNLTMLDASAPVQVTPGKAFSINCKYENNGSEAVETYDLVVTANSKELLRQTVNKTLVPGAQANYSLQLLPTNAWDRDFNYEVAIETKEDEVASDNSVVGGRIHVNIPDYPTVENLEGALDDTEHAVLTWQPVSSTVLYSGEVVEDFESYAHGEYQSIGDWTLYDGDGAKSGGFDGKNIAVEGLPASFFVLASGKESNIMFETVSGSKVLASVYNVEQKSDDWIISPLLTGEEQTISFWAASYYGEYPESFEVLVSSTDNSPESFTLLSRSERVAEEWTFYDYDLPAGTKYFAIRCISTDNLLFIVDDITYCPKDGTQRELTLVGYNVYRNGEKLTAEPLNLCEYTDMEHQGGRYAVTAVYDEGESGRSNEVSLVASGVDLIETDFDPAAEYYTIDGLRVEKPRRGTVYIVKRGNRVGKTLM